MRCSSWRLRNSLVLLVMRFILSLLLLCAISPSMKAQFMYDKFRPYSRHELNVVAHIDTSLRKEVPSSAAFLVYFEVAADSDTLTYSHTLSYTSRKGIDLSSVMDEVINSFGPITKAGSQLNGKTWCVLPVAIHHSSYFEWYKGLPSDLREAPEAFAALANHLLSNPENILPTLFVGRGYVKVLCNGG